MTHINSKLREGDKNYTQALIKIESPTVINKVKLIKKKRGDHTDAGDCHLDVESGSPSGVETAKGWLVCRSRQDGRSIR